MAKMGDGYGSKCHLLRWMGWHRKLFDERVSEAVGRPGPPIVWLDFDFDCKLKWKDGELVGLEFLYHIAGLEQAWRDYWPVSNNRRGIHNWDAVGWIGSGED